MQYDACPLPPKRRQAPKPSCRSYGSPADWSKVWPDFALILFNGPMSTANCMAPILSHLVVSLGEASVRVDRHRAVASRQRLMELEVESLTASRLLGQGLEWNFYRCSSSFLSVVGSDGKTFSGAASRAAFNNSSRLWSPPFVISRWTD